MKIPTARGLCPPMVLVLTILVFSLWLWVIMGERHVLLAMNSLVESALLLFIVAGTLSWVAWTLSRTKNRLQKWCAVLAFVLLFPLGLWAQRHTNIGVSALGGSHFWIRQAAANPNPEAARDLDLVLSATQYGVDAAERAVLKLESPEQRRRLFLLLAERAPTERWKERYRRLAEEGPS